MMRVLWTPPPDHHDGHHHPVHLLVGGGLMMFCHVPSSIINVIDNQQVVNLPLSSAIPLR